MACSVALSGGARTVFIPKSGKSKARFYRQRFLDARDQLYASCDETIIGVSRPTQARCTPRHGVTVIGVCALTVRVLCTLHKFSKKNAARDSTVYGTGRASTRSFFVHHSAAI